MIWLSVTLSLGFVNGVCVRPLFSLPLLLVLPFVFSALRQGGPCLGLEWGGVEGGVWAWCFEVSQSLVDMVMA